MDPKMSHKNIVCFILGILFFITIIIIILLYYYCYFEIQGNFNFFLFFNSLILKIILIDSILLNKGIIQVILTTLCNNVNPIELFSHIYITENLLPKFQHNSNNNRTLQSLEPPNNPPCTLGDNQKKRSPYALTQDTHYPIQARELLQGTIDLWDLDPIN